MEAAGSGPRGRASNVGPASGGPTAGAEGTVSRVSRSGSLRQYVGDGQDGGGVEGLARRVRLHQATTPEPMQRGLGSAGLWSFTPAAGRPPLVVRVFAAAQVAEREHAAMVAAGSGGVPVPEFVMRGVLRGQAVHVLTFIPVAARRGSGPGPAAAPRLPPCQRAH